MDTKIFSDLDTLKTVFYWGGLSLFLLLELGFSYRRSSVSKARRWIANVSFSAINGSVYYVIYASVLAGIMVTTKSNRLGLLNLIALPEWVKMALGILMLDFFLYIWHLLNHTVLLHQNLRRLHQNGLPPTLDRTLHFSRCRRRRGLA